MTRNIGPTWPKSEWDHLPIAADGRKVGDTDTATLNARLDALQVPGFESRAICKTAFSAA